MNGNDKTAKEFNSGKVDAFRKFYDGYFAALCVFACKYVEDTDLAADIVQDVFVALWEKRGDFPSEAAMRSFLYTATRNRALNHIKHKNIHAGKSEEIGRAITEQAEAEAVIGAEAARHIMTLLDRLPAECRTVLRLTVEGKSYGEIATQLGITVSTVRNHRVRAVKKLRALAVESEIELLVMIRPFLTSGCSNSKQT